MNTVEMRKILKNNEFSGFWLNQQDRKLTLFFENNHTLTVELGGQHEIKSQKVESVEIKIDNNRIARI